ncbi:MAG: helix-turn-helix domain-containing protein [Cellvibrionales bacterium]|nr:helix-turn-helix domain-containing protein [Cellvibrionales bacterium]
MNMPAHHQPPPNARDAAIARAAAQALSRYARTQDPLKLHITDQAQTKPIELPAPTVALLLDILKAMAAGHSVTLIPENPDLTTVQAADLLNVSRPFLIKLLDEQQIPHRKIGKHRRIRAEDVLAYKTTTDQQLETALDELVADAQEQGLYD